MPPMNTSPDKFVESSPKLKPLPEALNSVYKEIESSKRETPNTFFDNGREKIATSNLERAMADLQASVRISEEVLNKAIESGDYRREEVAAKACAAMNAGLTFAQFYAETFSQSPEAAESLQNVMLGLFKTTNAEPSKNDENEVANDKYLLQA